MFQQNQPKVLKAWTMYDWANSVYSLTITTAVFPIYYTQITTLGGSDLVQFLGFELKNTVLLSYSLAFSFLIIACLAPILSGIADYAGRKKFFMKIFVWIGSLACMGLFFFTEDRLGIGILFSVLASVGYAGSLVFYNSFLPVIASPDRHDKLSAKGFSMGYIGSVILLIINLVFIMMPETFGFHKDSDLPARFSFVMVGLWWLGFSQISFKHLHRDEKNAKIGAKIMFHGFKELRKVWNQVKEYYALKQYLLGFFIYSMGVQTVMLLASAFGSKELGLETTELIITVLIIQIIAILGASMFARLSGKIGNIKTLIFQLIVWIGVCIGAYFVTDNVGFFILAFFVGLVMGGIQSLSRSTYSKLLPQTDDHASFFSFYDMAEKVSIVIGMVTFGLLESLTGSMRMSVLSVLLFFVVGIAVLLKLNHQSKRLNATE